MKAIRRPNFGKLIEVMEINGVKVFFHWSVLLTGAVILLGALEDPALAVVVLASLLRRHSDPRVRPHGRSAKQGLCGVVDRVVPGLGNHAL
jgi:hypothetical protein